MYKSEEREEVLGKITLCVFQKEKGGDWEPGLLFNGGRLGILDSSGNKLAKNPWDYRECPEFTVDISDLVLRYKNHPVFVPRQSE